MTTVDITGWELHNVVRDGDELRVRRSAVAIKSASGGTAYVAGFTIESPNTTEPWHYLFEQNSTTSVVTLRCFTEEYLELWNFPLGPMQKNPIVTCAVQNNQGMFNSPAFSAPLYFLVGGGCITATKTTSENEDTTALDLPAGHICSFGDRMPIAQGNVVFFNDPGVDPRTYVAENVLSLPGSVFDMFQGPSGALYFFTSAGVYTVPMDALGQGQAVQGFLSRIPGIETSGPRNAAASAGAVAVLQKDHVLVLPNTKIPIGAARGRRYYSRAVETTDLRSAAELHATPGGFIVAFRGSRDFYTYIDLDTQTVSHIGTAHSAFNVVGTLRTREGDPLLLCSSFVVDFFVKRALDTLDGGAIEGVIVGSIAQPPGQTGVLRRITLATDNIGTTGDMLVGTVVNGDAATTKNPTNKTGDLIIGTSAWAATGNFAGRNLRTTRFSHAKRGAEHSIELYVRGGGATIGPSIDVEFVGQGRKRRDLP